MDIVVAACRGFVEKDIVDKRYDCSERLIFSMLCNKCVNGSLPEHFDVLVQIVETDDSALRFGMPVKEIRYQVNSM